MLFNCTDSWKAANWCHCREKYKLRQKIFDVFSCEVQLKVLLAFCCNQLNKLALDNQFCWCFYLRVMDQVVQVSFWCSHLSWSSAEHQEYNSTLEADLDDQMVTAADAAAQRHSQETLRCQSSRDREVLESRTSQFPTGRAIGKLFAALQQPPLPRGDQPVVARESRPLPTESWVRHLSSFIDFSQVEVTSLHEDSSCASDPECPSTRVYE